MTVDITRRCDGETAFLALLASVISVCSFFCYLRQGELLLYGDAVAHINIARRLFDSRTPGLLQLGTVWLPLPHLGMIPFVISDWLWRTGVGGSIPSMIAYVFGVFGIFRLTRSVFPAAAESAHASRIAAWASALVYAANPNLIYLQTTAMTEPIYLALFVWTLVYFSDFLRAANAAKTPDRSLIKSGLCVAAACLTRYDGWFLSVVLSVIVILTTHKHAAPNRSVTK